MTRLPAGSLRVQDNIRYREYKILLRPDRVGDADGFEKFWHKIETIADACRIDIKRNKAGFTPQTRDVLFYDTQGFELYRNAFILRQRTRHDRTQPENEHELTVKYRHPNLKKVEGLDLHPTFSGDGRIKFKEEVLPLREEIGGLRSLYSHNCVALAPDAGLPRSLHDLLRSFPALGTFGIGRSASVSLVNDLTVEETEVEPGVFDFGHGYEAKATIALWRDRATRSAMVGEFGFQAKFHDLDEIHQKALARSEEFFRAVQTEAPKWLHLGTTKTALVYAMHGTAAPDHE
jgi:hypothetical protein